MSEFFLSHSYFQTGRDNPILFMIGHSFGVFQFVFGQLAVGDVAGLLFVAALIFLVRGGTGDSRAASALTAERELALFLALCFALVCGASLAHFYPYGGTRHSAILLIPALAGVSIASVRLLHKRWDRAVVFAALIDYCVRGLRQAAPTIHAA